MEKHNKQLVIDYINGNDIEDYNLNELENDKLFMTKVIDYSNDEKMYNFCSDDLKKDYEFIKYIILKFRNNIKFITEVADYFLDNTDTDYERTELSIIMSELTKDDLKITKYNVLCDAIYSGKRLQIELYKLQNKDEELSNEIGMGFLLIYDLYNNSDIILDFYAKKIIEDIFTEYDLDLENILHSQFKTPDEINKKGLNNYMLSFIEMYDPMLASYASSRLDVLLPFKENIIKTQKNWNNYNNKTEQEKYELMFEKIHKYMEEADSIFTEDYLIYHIGSKLGILDKIRQYDYMDKEIIDCIIEDLSDEFVEQTFQVSFIDRVHYKNVKEIMISTLFGRNIDSTTKSTDDGKKINKCKILKLKFDNNNKKED